MNRIILTSFFIFVVVFSAHAARKVDVPNGNHIMVDGRCADAEWRRSTRMPVSEDYSIRFMKTRDYLYLCIESAAVSNFTMDLYFSPAPADLYTFHSSAKLGERKLTGENWVEFRTDWDWWNVSGWTANTRNFNSCDRVRFLPQKAIEYQIDRGHFGGKDWRVAIDILGLEKPFVFPADANKLKRDSWLALEL